jgi:hypothetical protein
MREIIENILEELKNSQINLQSESGRKMVVDKILPSINNYVKETIESVICGSNPTCCSNTDCQNDCEK